MSYFYWPYYFYHFFIIFPPLFFPKDPVLLWRIHWTSWYLGSSFAETEWMKRRMRGRKLYHLQVWWLIFFFCFLIFGTPSYIHALKSTYIPDLIWFPYLSQFFFFFSLSLSFFLYFFLISLTLFRLLPCPRLIILAVLCFLILLLFLHTHFFSFSP